MICIVKNMNVRLTHSTSTLQRTIFIVLITFIAFVWSEVAAFEKVHAHGGPVRDLALSPSQELMASASYDYSIVLWDTQTFTETIRLMGHEAAVTAVSFSDNGQMLASGGDDYTILIWKIGDLGSIKQLHPFARLKHTAKITDIEFSPDGQFLAASSWDGLVTVWSLDTFEPFASFDNHSGAVNSLQFGSSGLQLFSAGADGHIRVWSLDKVQYTNSLIRNGWGVNVFQVDEDLGFFALGGVDGSMKCFSLKNGELIFNVDENKVPVLAIDYDAENKLIAFGNAKGRVVIFDMRSQETIMDFKATAGPVWSIKIIPKIRAVAIAGLDDFITKFEIGEEPWDFSLAIGKQRRFSSNGLQLSNGERQFARKCSVCHSLTADGKLRAGPSLLGVFGRTAGSLGNYAYSTALKNSLVIWNEKTISDLFSRGPHIVTPGSKMPIQKIKDHKDRNDLIYYLKNATSN